nr:MAG TPA: hypothetical protein [Bacteriophage sp.]
MGRRNNLPNNTTLLNTHSCLATNKQILLKDEIKHNRLIIEDNGYRGETISPRPLFLFFIILSCLCLINI